MSGVRLWVRWSWRDIRSRWVQVAAIALIIALGTGTFAGLGSTARWRRQSADASYEVLGFRDLEVKLSAGSLVPQGTLTAALAGVGPGLIAAAEERLRFPTQVDASTADQTILVPGVVIGVPVAAGGPEIDRLQAVAGRALTASDAGAPVVLVERNFAEVYKLPAAGALSVAGGRELSYVGQASAPDYFIVMSEDGSGFQVQANFAALFTSLETAQDLAGAPGQVNRLLIRLSDGADPAVAAQAVAEALADRLPEVGATVVPRADNPGYAMIYQDIENDQQTFSIFAMLIFVGAVAAAFNLTARLVEAQRREIGIAMALGVPRRRIAIRPLLVAAQIALLGVALGVAVGWVIGVAHAAGARGLLPPPHLGDLVPGRGVRRGGRGRLRRPVRRSGLSGVARRPGAAHRSHPARPPHSSRAHAVVARAPAPGQHLSPPPGAEPGAGPAPHAADGGGHRVGHRRAHRAARHDRFLLSHRRHRRAADPRRAGGPGDRGVRPRRTPRVLPKSPRCSGPRPWRGPKPP